MQAHLDWEPVADFARSKFSVGYTPGHVMQLAVHGGASARAEDIDAYVWWEWEAWLNAVHPPGTSHLPLAHMHVPWTPRLLLETSPVKFLLY